MQNHSGPHTRNEGITILLVEDDSSVRRLVSQTLMLTGYTVLEAANGPEALQLMEQQATGVDLLLTDVVMPYMNGGELAERLTRIYLDRIDRFDAKLRSVITRTSDVALAQARKADEEIAAGRHRDS